MGESRAPTNKNPGSAPDVPPPPSQTFKQIDANTECGDLRESP